MVQPVSGAPWSGPVDEVPVPGVVYAPLPRHEDGRGWFVKAFQASRIEAAGGEGRVREVYLSSSQRGALRGMHFQVPPHDHAKTVVCLSGAVVDVVVDLRAGSPAEGRAVRFRLDGAAPGQLHLPPGIAHGFQALVDDTIVAYVVSTEHAPEHDRGIRWDSVGVTWPLPPTAISGRDRGFPPLDRFRSPFIYVADR